MKRVLIAAVICFALFGMGIAATVHMMSETDHAGRHMHHSGSGQHKHDTANMPMLHGKNTTQDEVAHLRTLFQQHPPSHAKSHTLKMGSSLKPRRMIPKLQKPSSITSQR